MSTVATYPETRIDTIKSILKPGTFALVVVDKQHGYFSPDQPLPKLISSNHDLLDQAIERMDNFISYFRDAIGEDIIWIQMVEDVNSSPKNIATKLAAGDIDYITKEGDKSFDFIGLKPDRGETRIVKHTYDVLADNETQSYLKTNPNIETLIIIGGYTSRCVLSSAIGANSLGLNVIVPRDLVSMPDGIMHEEKTAFSIINTVLGYVVDSDQLKELIDPNPDSC